MQGDDAPGSIRVGLHPIASFGLWGKQYSHVGNTVSTYFHMPIIHNILFHYVWIYFDILLTSIMIPSVTFPNMLDFLASNMSAKHSQIECLFNVINWACLAPRCIPAIHLIWGCPQNIFSSNPDIVGHL